MKDYLNRYLTSRTIKPPDDISGDELPKPTKPINHQAEESFVSFDSDQPLEYPGIDDEVAWRARVMLRQIPDRGPIPFLTARAAIDYGSGRCSSCGDPLSGNDGFCCGPCSRAVNLALELVMARQSKGYSDGKAE